MVDELDPSPTATPEGDAADASAVMLVEPHMGRVLGVEWGSRQEHFLAEHPDARLERDAGDAATYSLSQPADQMRPALDARFVFQLEELVAVELRPAATGPRDRAAFLALVNAALSRFQVPLAHADDGFEAAAEAHTRLTVDHFDGVIRVEESH